jgi:cytochrome c oxidase cbb3-type subunit 3
MIAREFRPMLWRICVLTLLTLATVAAILWIRQRDVEANLLRTDPGQILNDPSLLTQAIAIATPRYERHCARCHGAQLQGDAGRGVPDLARNVWLYGNDPVDVEHTILYGIRSGHPKARNLTDMPALVRKGQISADDARDVVEYLQSLRSAPHDEAATLRGRAIYYNKGACYDCHGNEAQGVAEYGAPALTGPLWLYGGDRVTLYQSILDGRHGECPAWVRRLTPVQIRALAIYLVNAPRASALVPK